MSFNSYTEINRESCLTMFGVDLDTDLNQAVIEWPPLTIHIQTDWPASLCPITDQWVTRPIFSAAHWPSLSWQAVKLTSADCLATLFHSICYIDVNLHKSVAVSDSGRLVWSVKGCRGGLEGSEVINLVFHLSEMRDQHCPGNVRKNRNCLKHCTFMAVQVSMGSIFTNEEWNNLYLDMLINKYLTCFIRSDQIITFYLFMIRSKYCWALIITSTRQRVLGTIQIYNPWLFTA